MHLFADTGKGKTLRAGRGCNVIKMADSKFIFYLSFYFATQGIVYSERNGKVVFKGFI